MKEYVIGGRKFIQKPLVLAQWPPLIALISGLVLKENMQIDELLAVLGDKLPQALAIVLREDGKSLKDKNVEELTTFFEENVPIDIAVEVVTDFFDLTPIHSSLNSIGKLMEKVNSMSKVEKTGSENLEVSSPEETLQSETA